jgi:hypothetical protein
MQSLYCTFNACGHCKATFKAYDANVIIIANYILQNTSGLELTSHHLMQTAWVPNVTMRINNDNYLILNSMAVFTLPMICTQYFTTKNFPWHVLSNISRKHLPACLPLLYHTINALWHLITLFSFLVPGSKNKNITGLCKGINDLSRFSSLHVCNTLNDQKDNLVTDSHEILPK